MSEEQFARVEDTSKRARGTVTADADLTALAKISREINKLSGEDRTRVIQHIVNKYGPEVQ